MVGFEFSSFLDEVSFWCLPGPSQTHFLESFWHQVGAKLAPKSNLGGLENQLKKNMKKTVNEEIREIREI